MEKIKLNNQVVSMRKFVKQAKVHTINKLAKQIKLLQNRKGSESQVQKAKRKAERLLAEIALLKKIKPDNVSKLALSKARNWKDVLQQKSITLEDRCIAMLATYEAVHKEVEAFHSSNGELVLKISDLIKQWDEKSKYSKNSPKNKVISSNKEDKKTQLSMKTNENILNNEKTESDTEELDNQFDSEDEKMLMSDNCNKISDKQNKLSIEPLENTENKECSLDLKTTIKTGELNNFENQENNTMETEEPNIDKESKHDDDDTFQSSKLTESHFSPLKNELPNSNEVPEENTMETENSDSVESEQDSASGITERTQIVKNNVTKLEQPDISEIIKIKGNKTNSSENKLKAIALLKLDELQGLDEIPVDEKDQFDESTNGSSEEETIQTLQTKRKDPFFLGCGDEDSVSEEQVTTNNDYISKAKNSIFSKYGKGSEKEKNVYFEQKDSNQYNHKRNVQKLSSSSQFRRRDFSKFKNERENFKSFQKEKFIARNHQNKFQPNSKNTFDRNNSKNQRNFKIKDKFSCNFNEKASTIYTNSDRNKVSTEPHRKSKESEKPLHPSWEAKRKQKEMKNASFQGKRMVFDD